MNSKELQRYADALSDLASQMEEEAEETYVDELRKAFKIRHRANEVRKRATAVL